MQEFGVKYVETSRINIEVILEHVLWGRQIFKTDYLETINDDYRKGVIIKGREIFMYKQNVIKEAENQISDGRLTIYVNKCK